MGRISGLAREDFIDLQETIARRAGGCVALEEAAQNYVSVLYETLKESVVLARCFATVPFAGLPAQNREFVTGLARAGGVAGLLADDTLILSLLGTRGDKSEWNDRKKSRDHVGIPLAASAFIERIPMVSRLLKQLGAGIDWIDQNDTELVIKTFENLSGVFYVQSAQTETDSQGRKIIASQDFVADNGIQTVFGVGGCFMGTSLFFTTILFLRETIEKKTAEHFMLQANKFKASTLDLVDEGKIFFPT